MKPIWHHQIIMLILLFQMTIALPVPQSAQPLPKMYYRNIQLTAGLSTQSVPATATNSDKVITSVAGLSDTTIGVLFKAQNGTLICKSVMREGNFGTFTIENENIRGMQINWSDSIEEDNTTYRFYKIKNSQQTFIQTQYVGVQNTVGIHYILNLDESGNFPMNISPSIEKVKSCAAVA